MPGIRGLGNKIAVELLQRFDTLDSIYANINEIQNLKTKNLLESGYESAIFEKSN